MGKSVRVPGPVYERLSNEAERQDVSRGAIIKDWMHKAEKYEDLDNRGY